MMSSLFPGCHRWAAWVTAVIHQWRLINQKCQHHLLLHHAVTMVTRGGGRLRSTSALPLVLGHSRPMPISASQCQFELAGLYIIMDGLLSQVAKFPIWSQWRKVETVKQLHFNENQGWYKMLRIITLRESDLFACLFWLWILLDRVLYFIVG